MLASMQSGPTISLSIDIASGSHLIAWTPRVGWGGKEETQKVVRRGIKYILEADKMTELEEIMYQ
jgi:hypothetical protein